MEKKFLIVNRGKDKYGLTHSHLKDENVININKNISNLRDITDIGRETNNIILRSPNISNTGTGFDDYLTDIEFLGDGSFMVIGGFTEYNGVSYNNITKLRADGSIDTSFQVGSGFVGLIAFSGINQFLYDKSDNGVWMIGSFTSYSNIPANGIIKVDASSGGKIEYFNYGIGFNTTYKVYGILADTLSNSIYLHGIFTSYNGTVANSIIRLLANGSIDTNFNYGTGFNNAVVNVKVNMDGSIICSGYFSTYKGIASSRIIKIDRYGNNISSFIAGSSFNNSGIYLNRDNSNSLFAYGEFTSYKGVVANRIVKIDINTGSIDMSFYYGSGFNGNTVALYLNDDGTLYVGGSFTTYNSNPANRMIKLLSSGSIDSSFQIGAGFNDTINHIEVNDDKIVVTGEFTEFNGKYANRIIVLNLDGSIYDGIDFSFLEGKAEYNITSLENTTDKEILPKKLIEELIYNNNFIKITKEDIDRLIFNYNLKAGVTYNIIDADTNLYGGTSIFLRAVSNNTLELSGSGEFYTPKYKNVPGYGIWSKLMSMTFSSPNYNFSDGEYVNGNNSSVGRYKANGLITWLSGNWNSTTLITGSSSGATVSISGATRPTHATNSTVIYGGRLWINKTGSVGNDIDTYTLDSTNWKLVEYNKFEYNFSVDDIKYDILNDRIIYRKDRHNNIVDVSNLKIDFMIDSDYGFGMDNPIKAFQWGNGLDNFIPINDMISFDDNKKGVVCNHVINSFLGCINSTSKYIWDNSLEIGSYMLTDFVDNKSSIHSNKLINSGIISNLKDSSIYLNNLVNSTIVNISLYYGSAIVYCIVTNGAIESSELSVSNITNCNLVRGTLRGLPLINSSISFNIENGLFWTNNNWLQNKTIRYVKFSGVNQIIDISIATVIFDTSIRKEVYERSDGLVRIRYWDVSDINIILPIGT